MSDDRVVEYLRSRAVVEPPPNLVGMVMASVEEAPRRRSTFAAFLPAVAVAGAVAVLIALAVILGQGPEVGPPDPSASAGAEASPVTMEDLRSAVESAVAVLRESPGVEGTGTSSVLGELSNATWFTWRAGGDQIVIQRTDVDVAQTAWWLDPEGGPPARGENVTTTIHVFVGRDAFVAESDEWVAQPRDDIPPMVSLATGILDGEVEPDQQMMGDGAGAVTVTREGDGGTTWTLTGPYRDGTATSEWHVAADGHLSSWSGELTGVTPSVEDTTFVTSHRTDFEPLAEPAPIEAPAIDSPPDPATLGLPPDFPL